MSGLLLLLVLLTSTGCCANSLPPGELVPLPANRVDEPTDEELRRIVQANNWLAAYKLLREAWNYIYALVRVGGFDLELEEE